MRLRGPASAVAVGCVLAIACSAVPVRRVSTTRVMPPTDLSIEEPIRLKQPLAVVWNRREDTDYLGRIGPRTLRVRRLVHLGAQGSEIHDLSPDATKIAFARPSSRFRV